jgi:Calcineurin-like phosphoesterase
VGGGADGSDDARKVARRIGAGRVDRFLYLGDVYEDGTAAEYADHYRPIYGHLDKVTAPTPGNHEWPNHIEGYDPYWKKVRGKEPPSWHSFRVAGWKLLALNSEDSHDRGSAQVRWLRSELRAPGTCRLAFWHRPRYSVGEHDDQADVQPFWDALEGHATLVVNGHEHNMQRYVPIDGMTELVSGAGGQAAMSSTGESLGMRSPTTPTTARSGSSFGPAPPRLSSSPPTAAFSTLAECRAGGRKQAAWRPEIVSGRHPQARAHRRPASRFKRACQ